MTTATQYPTATAITPKTGADANNAGSTSNTVAAQTAKAQAGIGQTYSQFLSLLTTQLKNQDPLSPMDSAQFTNQLVLFSQVEQQINANTSLGNIYQLLQSFQAMQAQNYLGDTVMINSNTIALNDANPNPAIGFNFANAPSNVDVQIFNSSGTMVAELKGGGGKTSENLNWDGTDFNGEKLPAGNYIVKINGTFDGQQKPALNVMTGGLVTNVKTDATGTQLQINGSWVALSNVVSILATPAQSSGAAINSNLQGISKQLANIQGKL